MSRDLTLLHPSLQEKFAELKRRCALGGLLIKNTSTYRDRAEQEDCVARGTSRLHYPDSLHNWGAAVDFCRNDGKDAYDDSDGFFAKVGHLAESLGLIWGGSFSRPDKPHLQLADWGKTASVLKARYKTPQAFRDSWKKDGDNPSPVRLTVGMKVKVDGVIYGNGDGSGGSIKKNSAVMYVVDDAGEAYRYRYGVAKAKGGIRQGWARADHLTILKE